MLTGAAAPVPDARFGTLQVQRIEVREPDGTLRLMIYNAARAPGIIVKNHETPHPNRASAGLLFYNNEGTENGGLIFDGEADAASRHSSGSLTFDRYEQDQVVQVFGVEDGARRSAGVIINDQPEPTLDFAAIGRAAHATGAAQASALRAAHAGSIQRAFIGRGQDGASQVALRDGAGRGRLVLKVLRDGTAAVQFLDADGRVTRTLSG